MEGSREVSIILHRRVTSRDLKFRKAGFSLECLNIFATGCSLGHLVDLLEVDLTSFSLRIFFSLLRSAPY